MMEQLAERRMQREEEAQYAAAGLTNPSMQNPHAGHNHGTSAEDDEYDEDDEEFDSQEEEFDEEDDETV